MPCCFTKVTGTAACTCKLVIHTGMEPAKDRVFHTKHVTDLKVVLWQKSHLSYVLSHFKTETSSLHEKKPAVYFFQISLFVPVIIPLFKINKLAVAKLWCHTCKLNHILIKYDEKNISANLYHKCLIVCSRILVNVFHNTSLTVFFTMATYWVPDIPNIKSFSGHFWQPFWYLLNIGEVVTRESWGQWLLWVPIMLQSITL